MSYLKNNLIALDQLLNTLLDGSPDETLSSRAYRADKQGKVFGKLFRPIIDTLLFLQDEHCKQSYLSELSRKHLPETFRDKDSHAREL